MTTYSHVGDALVAMLRDLLRRYDEFVTERGPFPDLSARARVHFGDPDTTLPASLEMIVMNMHSSDEPQFVTQRFVSVRVAKGRSGGFVSLSCFHGTKKELRELLEEQADDPSALVVRVNELAEGLPEETNHDVWR